jgi:hypothetical protein
MRKGAPGRWAGLAVLTPDTPCDSNQFAAVDGEMKMQNFWREIHSDAHRGPIPS